MGEIKLLECGNCEDLKVGVHATALTLAVIMGAYNAAAWLLRRQTHLGVNTVMYSVLTIWEIEHVKHHWRARPNRVDRGEASSADPGKDRKTPATGSLAP